MELLVIVYRSFRKRGPVPCIPQFKTPQHVSRLQPAMRIPVMTNCGSALLPQDRTSRLFERPYKGLQRF